MVVVIIRLMGSVIVWPKVIPLFGVQRTFIQERYLTKCVAELYQSQVNVINC